jgi:hypothetical protein
MGEGEPDADPNTPSDNAVATLLQVKRGGHGTSPFFNEAHHFILQSRPTAFRFYGIGD